MSEKSFDAKYYEDQMRLHKEQEFLTDKAKERFSEGETVGAQEYQTDANLTEELRRARTRKHLGIKGDENTQTRDQFMTDNFSPDGGLSSERQKNQFDAWRDENYEGDFDEGEEPEEPESE